MSMSVGLLDEKAVTSMIQSREWWVMVGNHHVFGEIEERFYPEGDGSFMTVFGPPVGPLATVFTGLMVLSFGRKSKMSPAQLMEFMNSHPERKGLPPLEYSDERDVIFLIEPDEVEGGER